MVVVFFFIRFWREKILQIFLSRQLEVAGLKEAGPVVEKEAVLRLTTFLIDKVGYLLLFLIDKVG